MQLTKGQENGLKIAVERFKNKEPYTVIAGYAGTGKSTLIPYIVEALNIPEEQVMFATLTGKAALVLRNKGCQNAMTLHKLLYIPKKVPNSDEVEFVPRETLEGSPSLIVVDEASMVSKEIFDLLLTHKVHIIFLGDTFQLPAISESANILDNPHVMLTEITRQALDSPIIRLSMDIREGKPLNFGGPKEARIMPKNKVSQGLLLGADIVLCARNDTRRGLNDKVRKLKWGDKYREGPIDGDRLICLHNYWKITDTNNESPLLNGLIGNISKITIKETKALHPKLTGMFIDDVGNVFSRNKFNIDYKLLTKGELTVNNENWRDFYRVRKPLEFDYGYVVTTWKAQGSQWDKVLIFEEDFPYDKETHAKFLYTSVTRASEKCVLVR